MARCGRRANGSIGGGWKWRPTSIWSSDFRSWTGSSGRSSCRDRQNAGRVEDGRESVAERRPVSHPRSSNRTCLSQASGFPTGFIVNSQTRVHRPLQAKHTKRAEHPFLGELAGALRGHLVTPSQKVPYRVVDISVNRPVSLAPSAPAKVCSPAVQNLIQPLTHLFPGGYVTRHQMVSHFRFDLAHTLVRRTVSDILPTRPPAVVRPECISQKIELLPTCVPDTRLLLVEC